MLRLAFAHLSQQRDKRGARNSTAAQRRSKCGTQQVEHNKSLRCIGPGQLKSRNESRRVEKIRTNLKHRGDTLNSLNIETRPPKVGKDDATLTRHTNTRKPFPLPVANTCSKYSVRLLKCLRMRNQPVNSTL